MSGLREEIAAFLENKQSRIHAAGQMAALQIACHFDLTEAMSADADTRKRIALRLERTIERERQRGMRKHWSYDLNRHIALKQALDKLRALDGRARTRAAASRPKARRRPKAPSQINA